MKWGRKDNEGGGKKQGRREKEDNTRREDVRMSLSPFPSHYPPRRTESEGVRVGGGEVEGLWGEMTFSFVLLKAPYYYLSRPFLSPSPAPSPPLPLLPLAAPTIASNRSFRPLPLCEPPHPPPLFSYPPPPSQALSVPRCNCTAD